MRLNAVKRDHRRAMRLDVTLGACLREPGSSHRFDVDVIDLSMNGLRFETSFSLKPGNVIFLTIAGMNPLEARVVWVRGYIYGAEFGRSLHHAVFDHIAARHRKI